MSMKLSETGFCARLGPHPVIVVQENVGPMRLPTSLVVTIIGWGCNLESISFVFAWFEWYPVQFIERFSRDIFSESLKPFFSVRTGISVLPSTGT